MHGCVFHLLCLLHGVFTLPKNLKNISEEMGDDLVQTPAEAVFSFSGSIKLRE